MSYRLRPRRNSGMAAAEIGGSPLTVMDLNRLGTAPPASSSTCIGQKRSPPISVIDNDNDASVVLSAKRLRSVLSTPSPHHTLTEASIYNRSSMHLSSARSSSDDDDDAVLPATSLLSPAQQVPVAVVTPSFSSAPTFTASCISMTSSRSGQSLTNLPPTSPLRSSKKGTMISSSIDVTPTPARNVRTDDLQMTAIVPDGSIGKNAQDYYLLIKKAPNQKISMKDAATKLGIKVRRVYDVTNILEGVGLLKKCGLPEMSMQLCSATGNGAAASEKEAIQNEIELWNEEEKQLDAWIELLQNDEVHSEDKAFNYVPVSNLFQLLETNRSSVVISMKPGSAVHRGANGRSNCSFSIHVPPSGSGPSESMTAIVLDGSNKSKPSIRPLLLTYPPLLTACSSDFTEHALRDFNNPHHRKNNYQHSELSQSTERSEMGDTEHALRDFNNHHHRENNSQHSEFSQSTERSEMGDFDEKDRLLMSNAASTLARMAVTFDKVERSPVTAPATRPSRFWSSN